MGQELSGLLGFCFARASRGCIPRRWPSGASCAMQGSWPTGNRRIHRETHCRVGRDRTVAPPTGGEREPVEMIRGNPWCDGKTAGALGVSLRGHERRSDAREALIGAYRQLVGLDVPMRLTATLLGLSRTTIYRKPSKPQDRVSAELPSKLSAAEWAAIPAALNPRTRLHARIRRLRHWRWSPCNDEGEGPLKVSHLTGKRQARCKRDCGTRRTPRCGGRRASRGARHAIPRRA